MEVDTGASCSVMSLDKFKEVGQLRDLKIKLSKTENIHQQVSEVIWDHSS